MAVISEYEEEQVPMQSHTSTPKPSEPVKPPESVNPPEEQQPPRPPSPSPSPQSDEKLYQHDPILRALLEEHKRQPLELLTTVIDFLFRETDLSRESRVEHRVTEIVTAAKRSRSACDGEDVAPEKIAKKDPKSPTKTPYQTPRGDETTESSDVTLKEPPPRKALGYDQAEIDSEGTGLQPNIGNGYDHEKYAWTQTLGELTLHMHMPEGTKAKSVACEIKRSTLKAGLKGQEPILEGEFYQPVKVDDCTWSLDPIFCMDGKADHTLATMNLVIAEEAKLSKIIADEDGTLSIYVTKFNRQEWWRSVLKGEPEINSRKVEPEKSRLDDLDSETRQTAEKMMYDQRQKALGLPTSEESNKSDLIQKFMNQHPEMDFSKVKLC